MFSLQELCDWTGGSVDASPDVSFVNVSFDGIETDTRLPLEGKLFVALKGSAFDGNLFAGKALEAGARAVLIDKSAAFKGDAVHIAVRVNDTHEALNNLAIGWKKKLAPWIVGLTGSVGKTTVKEITAAFLSVAASTFKTPGNWNNNFGVPKSILEMPETSRCAVLETGTNHPGEIAPLARIIAPNAAILTNIAPCHIANFKDGLAGIANEKADLLRSVPSNGFVVLDKNSDFFDYLAGQVQARVVTVSGRVGDCSADYYATAFDSATGEVKICCSKDGEAASLPTGLIGEHQLINILQGAAVAHEYGIALSKLVAACPIVSDAKMRWERIEKFGYHWINDAYNANPLSMSKAVETFAKLKAPARKIVVLGDMFELGENSPMYHRQVGEVVGRCASQIDLFVAIGVVSKEAMVQGAIAAGMSDEYILGFESVAQAKEALYARGILKPEDTILIKASRGMALEALLEI